MATFSYILQNIDPSSPYQTFRCVLDDITYEMTWQWNTRCEFWTCAIGAVGDTPMVKYKITANSDPLLVYGYNENLPQGSLITFSLYTPRNRVAIDSVGEDKVHWFVYIPEDE